MKALAVTDHGNLFALKSFYDECRTTKGYDDLPPIKPILGCETYVTSSGDYKSRDKEETRYHLCLHALNLTGYHNLVKLISEAHINGVYYNRPRIDHTLLEKYHEGLHCSAACIAGEVPSALAVGRLDEAERIAKWYKDLFGDNYSLEVMLHQANKRNIPPHAVDEHRELYERQKQVLVNSLELGKKLGIRVIATNDVHFLDVGDDDSHDVLLCISTGKKLTDEKRLIYTGEEWFKDGDAMAQIFAEHPELLMNTLEVAERVENFELDSSPIMPKFPIPPEFGTEEGYAKKFNEEQLRADFPAFDKLGGYDKVLRVKLESDYLAHLVWEGAAQRWPGDKLTDDKRERIQFELDTIRKMGFPGYFLIVNDYISAARRIGVWVGPGRGSAAGAAVAYSLGITNVDPIKYDLLFERFLNPDRISMPDIDVDFDDAGRGRVLDYVVDRYGRDHVAHIVTFGQMATKSAIKDVARVMEYPLADSNKLVALVPDAPKITFKKAMSPTDKNGEANKDYSPELVKVVNDETNPIVHKLMERAQRLEGSIRQPGVHACGIIISRDPLIETLPVMPTPDEPLLCTQYDGHFVEPVGLLKMDFLGLKTLTVEKECVSLIREFHGIELNPDDIPDDDAETYKLFGRGETTGLFQFESEGMKSNLRLLQPDRLEDLVAMNALYRPGPMAYIPQFIARKKGEEPIVYDHPLMEKYLKDTYGITVYQEQVMLLSRLLGGFTRGESDMLRKAMGKKQIAVMEELKVKFVNGCLNNPEFRIDKWKDEKEARKIIDKIWDDWKAFASYAFNKSHAVCYAWLAYQTGYLKQHYPSEFMCAQISSEIGNFDKLPGFVAEADAMGLKVLPPDVNASFARFTPVKGGGAILYGLAGGKGVGAAAADLIVSERQKNGPYKGLMDFASRLAGANIINKRVMEALVRSGAFDSLAAVNGMHRARYFDNIDFIVQRCSRLAKDRAAGQTDFFDMISGGDEQGDGDIPDAPKWSAAKCYKDERDTLGIYMTGHPLGAFSKCIQSLATFNLEQMKTLPSGAKDSVRVVGMLSSISVRTPKPDPNKPKKNLDPWAMLHVDDGTDEVDVYAFAKTYEKIRDWIANEIDQPILLCGEVSHRMIRSDNLNKPPEEGEAQFIVREVYPLVQGIAEFAEAVVVTLKRDDETLQTKVTALASIMKVYPGSLKLRLEFEWPDGHKVLVDAGRDIAPEAEFFVALEKNISAAAYRLETIKKIFLQEHEHPRWERR